MYVQCKNKDDSLKGKIPYTLEDRKYFNHETIHNSGVGYYANIHSIIMRKL
ncbi:hypothetical protein PL321_16575 [Caloramator sp. mosi_1]|uniref:hypothetical protein n=1 Tax=Caloramator sp. mosi_1 TaxID=3023090 RepID=UPI00235F0E76|nr:hypothetical protein [Caloramator sp. mosi_1]WDC83940.1 hypothetical protein PL321_16280 [Caloramator sp. mosi_1]WDC83979.1 hypothetical protein PL321_16575 [Caloramator sp. mosi_1]